MVVPNGSGVVNNTWCDMSEFGFHVIRPAPGGARLEEITCEQEPTDDTKPTATCGEG